MFNETNFEPCHLQGFFLWLWRGCHPTVSACLYTPNIWLIDNWVGCCFQSGMSPGTHTDFFQHYFASMYHSISNGRFQDISRNTCRNRRTRRGPYPARLPRTSGRGSSYLCRAGTPHCASTRSRQSLQRQQIWATLPGRAAGGPDRTRRSRGGDCRFGRCDGHGETFVQKLSKLTIRPHHYATASAAPELTTSKPIKRIGKCRFGRFCRLKSKKKMADPLSKPSKMDNERGSIEWKYQFSPDAFLSMGMTLLSSADSAAFISWSDMLSLAFCRVCVVSLA